jgi:hypothetical protein
MPLWNAFVNSLGTGKGTACWNQVNLRALQASRRRYGRPTSGLGYRHALELGNRVGPASSRAGSPHWCTLREHGTTSMPNRSTAGFGAKARCPAL